MEKKKVSLKSAAENAGKTAAGFLGKAKKSVIGSVDRNDDGTFDTLCHKKNEENKDPAQYRVYVEAFLREHVFG